MHGPKRLEDLSLAERLVIGSYIGVEAAFPVVVGLALVSVVFDWRVGAYALVAIVACSLVLRRLMAEMVSRHADGQPPDTALERWSQTTALLFFVLLAAGAVAATLGSTTGAYACLVGVAGTIAGHLLAGVSRYRSVMTRPWPEVAPLGDEDDDW